MEKNKKTGLIILGSLVGVGIGIALSTREAGGSNPPPESPPFTFGTPVVTGSEVEGMPGVMAPSVSVLITNNNEETVTHTVNTYMDYYAQPWSDYLNGDDLLCVPSERVITLDPGQSYQYEFDGSSAQNWLYQNFADFFIMDELGHQSEMTRLTS
jgi:hypothetical protein